MKDGLIFGVRILIMEKRVLESNSIPSYVHIDGNQLYITYDGQNFTCKYGEMYVTSKSIATSVLKISLYLFEIKIHLFVI